MDQNISENVIKELQNTIGTLYTQLAVMKSQANDIIAEKDKQIQELTNQLQALAKEQD